MRLTYEQYLARALDDSLDMDREEGCRGPSPETRALMRDLAARRRSPGCAHAVPWSMGCAACGRSPDPDWMEIDT